MSEFASRGRGREPGLTVRSAPDADRRTEQTPGERAHGAVTRLVRDVGAVADSLDAVRVAHESSDLERWQAARFTLDRNVAAAERARVGARSAAGNADPEARKQLEEAERTLEDHRRAAEALTGPPQAWKPVPREAEILAILNEPVVGSLRDGFARKEAELSAELAQLSPAESRSLIDRIRRRHPGDPIADKIATLVPERRERLVAVLAGASRRKARAAATSPAANAAPAPSRPTTAAGEKPNKLPDGIRGDLEAATGRSLDHVRLHTGEIGASTAAGHGARAVAVGSDIFMGQGQYDPASEDGRELIAHEVAHTVQAQVHSGPAAPAARREGGSSEAAEVDADAFATSFRKNGASARWTPSVGVGDRTPMRAPQVFTLKKSGHQPLAPTTPIYINTYRVRTLTAIQYRINAVGLADPHPRLRWTTQKQAKVAIGAAIAEFVDAASDVSLKQLMKLSYPADLFAIVDEARGAGGADWDPNVGLAVALAMSEPIDASIRRMGMRLRVQLDANPSMPRASDLVASCPLDGVVAGVLVTPGLVLQTPKKRGAADDTPGKPFADGVREVTYEWQGKYDSNLWNWIKVTSPKHATAEDVAHTPLAGGEVTDGSEQAYRIAANPPFFGIPFETARKVPEAVQHAPPKVQALLQTGPGPRVADPGALEQSAVSDDAALAQAPKPSKGDLPARRSLERAKMQLDFLWQRLSPWNASAPLVGATMFVERRRVDLERDHASATHWQAALAAQERVLYLASSEAADVLTQIEARANPGDSGQLQPAVRLLRAYAHAAGVSHLAGEAMPALEEARRQRALLPVALAEDKIRAAHEGAAALRGAQGERGASADSTADTTTAELPDLDRRAADLRLRFARGETPDPETVDQLAADADEVVLRERILAIKIQVQAVVRRADEVGLDKQTFSGGIPTPRALAHVLLDIKVPEWLGVLDSAKQWHGPIKGKTPAQVMSYQLRKAVDQVAQDIVGFDQVAEIGKWLQWANKAAADKELSNRIAALVEQLGIMIATGEIAGAAVAALRGVALGAEVISEVRGAGLAYKAVEIGIHAGLATAAQGATGGELSGRAFAENAIGILATSAAMKPFEGLLADSDAVEQEVERSWSQTAKRSAKVAAEMAIETGAGIAGSAIAHAATHGMNAATPGADDWIQQGIALAASRFVGQRMRGMHERIETAARELGPAAFEKLLAKVDALGNRATGVKQPTIPEARAFLVERRQLLDEERKLYETRVRSNNLVEAGAAASATKRLDTDLAASPVTATLRLAGLTPVVDGQVYEGTSKQVHDALAAANASGPHLHDSYDAATGVHRVSTGSETIEIHELGAAAHAQVHEVPRDQLADTLRRHQARGAAVRNLDSDGGSTTRRFEIDYPDGRRIVIVEADPERRPGVYGPPTAEEAAAARARADRAAAIQAHRDDELTRLIHSQTKPIVVDTMIIGAGQVGTMAYASLPNAAGPPPGVDIKAIPKVINIAPEGSMFGHHGDFRIGQKPGELRGPKYAHHPGEHVADHDAWTPASAHVRALAMTAYDAGMVTYKATVSEVQMRPAEGWGAGVPADAAEMPLRVIAGGKIIYGERLISGGGYGKPRPIGQGNATLAAHEPELLKHNKLVYAQNSMSLPSGTKVVMVVGDGATGAWACEAAIEAKAEHVYWIGRPPGPNATVSPEARAELAALGVPPEAIASFAKSYNERNASTFRYIREGRIEVGLTLADAMFDPTTQRVKATLGNDKHVVVDGIIAATGQVADLPKGLDEENIEFRMVTVPYRGKERLVALDAYDPKDGRPLGIRLQGGQMFTVPSALVAKNDRGRLKDLLVEQASDPSVPQASRGVVGSIYQTNIDVPLANEERPLARGQSGEQ